MAVIGSIEQFDVGTSDWPTYAARLDQFIAANAIDEDKKVATLLTVVGSATYKLFQNLLAPDKPSDKDYDQLCKALKDHLAPKPLIIAERYRFHKRDQRSGETTAQYIAELRRLARNCDFGGHLADALRDRFVSGVTNHTICKSLLSEDGLTLAKAEKMATAMETAARDAAELTPSNRQDVHRMVMKPRAQETCYRCAKRQDIRTKNATTETPSAEDAEKVDTYKRCAAQARKRKARKRKDNKDALDPSIDKDEKW